MDSNTPSGRGPGGHDAVGGRPASYPWFVDWVVAGVLALGGLALVVAGIVVFVTVTPGVVADAVADGSLQSDTFSGQALVDVTSATVHWGSIGLLLSGLLTWGLAAVFLVQRRRSSGANDHLSGDGPSSSSANAIRGAVASLLLSSVPFSPVLGGVLAGSLERRDAAGNARIGALSGILFALVPAIVAAFAAGGVVLGAQAAGESPTGALVAGVVFVGLAFSFVTSGAAGAIGGYLGGRFSHEDSDDSTALAGGREPRG